MHSSLKRRMSGSVAALLVVGSTLLATAGAATAADSRMLDIRSPGEAAGILAFTPVTAGGVTKTDIVVTNNGKQNLTKGHLLIGLAPAGSLPSDVTIADVFGIQGSASCTWVSGGSSVDCDFGSLTSKGAGRSRQVSVAFNVGETGPHSITAAIKVAETVQDVGSNTNFQTATGNAAAGAATCDALSTFVLSAHGDVNLLPTTDDGCIADGQRSALQLKSNSGSALVSLNDSDAGTCPAGFTCFGNTVQATVNNGATITPYLTWLISYSPELMEGINPKQVGFVHGDTIIEAGKKGACGDGAFTKDCIVGYTVDADGNTIFEIRTATNTTMRGLR